MNPSVSQRWTVEGATPKIWAAFWTVTSSPWGGGDVGSKQGIFQYRRRFPILFAVNRPLEERVDDGGRAEQIFQGVERRGTGRGLAEPGSHRLMARWSVKVGPRRRDEGSCAIGQDEDQVQAARSMGPVQDVEGVTFKGMVPTDDGDLAREVMEVASVWPFPSILSRMSR